MAPQGDTPQRDQRAKAEVEVLLTLGESVHRRMANSDDLAAIAVRVGDVARTRGADTVIGASPEGDRLAGAAAVASSGRLRLWRVGEPASAVLILDSVLITGVQIARATSALRELGVSSLSAVVVAATAESLGRVQTELGLDIESLDGAALAD